MSNSRGTLFVISAASGSGKSSLVDAVMKRILGTERVVTCTTRTPPGTERDGVDYHFLTVSEFEFVVVNDDFETAVDELASIVVAERNRVERQRSRLLDILKTFGVESLHA